MGAYVHLLEYNNIEVRKGAKGFHLLIFWRILEKEESCSDVWKELSVRMKLSRAARILFQKVGSGFCCQNERLPAEKIRNKKASDIWKQFWGSVSFWCGSGSTDLYLWLTAPDPDPTSFFSDFKDAKENFCVKILFCKHYFSPLITFMKKERIRSRIRFRTSD